MTIISTKRGTLDLTKHIDSQFIDQILAYGSWYLDPSGYIKHTRNSDTKRLRLHCVVFELANGPIPAGMEIDHIDSNKTNNFLANLRLVTHQHNLFNNSRAKGYFWSKQRKKWKAQIVLNGKTINLGCFNAESEARQAYLDAKAIYHVIP